MWGSRRSGTQTHETRRFYQNIFPNLTVVNVDKPSCYLRKFSPDGKYLIAFSLDQTSLEIYEYQGVTAGLLLTKDWTSDIVPSQAEEGGYIRSAIFDKLFKVSFNSIAVHFILTSSPSAKTHRQHSLCVQAVEPRVQPLHQRRPVCHNWSSQRHPTDATHVLRDVPKQRVTDAHATLSLGRVHVVHRGHAEGSPHRPLRLQSGQDFPVAQSRTVLVQ